MNGQMDVRWPIFDTFPAEDWLRLTFVDQNICQVIADLYGVAEADRVAKKLLPPPQMIESWKGTAAVHRAMRFTPR